MSKRAKVLITAAAMVLVLLSGFGLGVLLGGWGSVVSFILGLFVGNRLVAKVWLA